MKRALGDIDTSALLYNPRDRDFLKRIEKEIPEFKSYRAAKDRVTHKMFATYVVLMYDIKSPLWRLEPDYYPRMYEAARLANFPLGKKSEFCYEAERVLDGSLTTANNAIVAYVAKFGLIEYTQLIAYTTIFNKELSAVLGSKSGGTSGMNSTKVIEETGKKMKELHKFIFNTGKEDVTKEFQQALYARLEQDKLRIRPEEIIEILSKEGKLPADFSPYEEEVLPDSEAYLRENMTFQGDDE